MSTYLDRILEVHRARAAADRRPPGALLEAARASPAPRSFGRALKARPGAAVIAEIKRRSPSRGWLAEGLDPVEAARAFEAGGASALSVLTEEEFFGGCPNDLVAARGAVSVPVLRKDFTVSELDVLDARAMGADAVLLIVAALGQKELNLFIRRACDLGMDALVEAHDEGDIDRALDAGAGIIGVNQRDLVSFEVDRDRAERLAPLIPKGVVRVAESGVRDGADVSRLALAGYDAVLVGESVVTSPDRRAAVQHLSDAGLHAPPVQHGDRVASGGRRDPAG